MNIQTVFVPAIVFSIHMAVDNCFGVDDGDDDDDDATDVQNTHGQPPFTLPVTRYSQSSR